MPKEEKFDNYISELISTEELTELLKYIKKLAPGDQRLNFTVEDSGDGLVEGEAETWIEVKEMIKAKIEYIILP